MRSGSPMSSSPGGGGQVEAIPSIIYYNGQTHANIYGLAVHLALCYFNRCLERVFSGKTLLSYGE